MSGQASIGVPRFGAELERQLREHGWAQVPAIEVSPDSLRSIYRQWHEFFRSENKREYAFSADSLDGYFRFGSERAKGLTDADPKEFFHFYPWGRSPPSVIQGTIELFAQLENTAQLLLNCLDHYCPKGDIDLTTTALAPMIEASPRLVLRVTRYMGSPKGAEGEYLNAPHEDINLLTLIPAATAPGFMVRDRSGEWYEIAPKPHLLTVICGDMLEEWSQGCYAATCHAVRYRKAREPKERLSLSYFVNPRDEVRLSNKRSAGEFLAERLREIGLTPGQS